MPFYTGQDLGSQQTTAILKRPPGAPEQHAEEQFPQPSHKPSCHKTQLCTTSDYSLIAETHGCPYFKQTKKLTLKPHKACKGGGGPNSMLEELSSARRCEPHHSGLMSGLATGPLPKSSPGHHLDHHHQARAGVCAAPPKGRQEVTPCL